MRNHRPPRSRTICTPRRNPAPRRARNNSSPQALSDSRYCRFPRRNGNAPQPFYNRGSRPRRNNTGRQAPTARLYFRFPQPFQATPLQARGSSLPPRRSADSIRSCIARSQRPCAPPFRTNTPPFHSRRQLPCRKNNSRLIRPRRARAPLPPPPSASQTISRGRRQQYPSPRGKAPPRAAPPRSAARRPARGCPARRARYKPPLRLRRRCRRSVRTNRTNSPPCFSAARQGQKQNSQRA